MARRHRIALVTIVAALAFAGQAQASGGNYVFAGGNAKQRTQVRSALEASSFNWSLVPAQIKIHIAPLGQSRATRGEIWLDAKLQRRTLLLGDGAGRGALVAPARISAPGRRRKV